MSPMACLCQLAGVRHWAGCKQRVTTGVSSVQCMPGFPQESIIIGVLDILLDTAVFGLGFSYFKEMAS